MLARTMVKTILNVSKSFPVILLIGSGQVGVNQYWNYTGNLCFFRNL